MAGQKVKEFMEEGRKVTLEMDRMRVELALAQQNMQVDSGTTYDHGDLQEKVRTLEQRLIDRAPDQAELQQDMEDANAQLVEERKMVVEYWGQISRILKLTEVRRGNSDDEFEEKEDNGSDIAKFSGAARSKLQGWKDQLVLILARKAKT